MSFNYSLLRSGKDDLVWDHFVSTVPGSHHEQTIPWAKVREEDGWQSKRIVIKNNVGFVAGAQILVRNVSFIGQIGYISHGPCVKDHSQKYAEEIFKGIKQFARNERIKYLVMNLPYFGDYMLPLIKSYGYHDVIEGLPPKGLMDSTSLIDLSRSLDQILAGMKIKARYNIRNGLKKGVGVREGSRDDIELFFSLMIKTCVRRKSPPTHPDINFFYRLWDRFKKENWIRLDIAEYQGEPVCSILSFTFGDTFRIWKFGWSGEYGNLHPSNVLMWKLIELSKQLGYKYFDFVMLDKKVAKSIEQNLPLTEEIKSNYFYGPTKFKLSFGGNIVYLPGAYALFPNSFVRILFVSLGFFLKQKWIMKRINRLWEKLRGR